LDIFLRFGSEKSEEMFFDDLEECEELDFSISANLNNG
jgi:hypothetical protein